MGIMEQRGSAAEPFSSPSTHPQFPAARLEAWVRLAAQVGAVAALPTQETVAA
jgi:hypothetical protein